MSTKAPTATLSRPVDDRGVTTASPQAPAGGTSSPGPDHHYLDELAESAGRLMGRFWWWLPGLVDGEDSRERAEPLTLPDGTLAWIRPILPTDRETHVACYEQVSDDSKYSRFLAPVPHLTEDLLKLLVDDVDGVDHVAYYLFVDGENQGLPVAVGRIVRVPDDPSAADIAVTVQDDWHGRGLATAMMRLLVERRPSGVTHLVTIVLANNRPSRRMLRRIGPTKELYLGDGAVEVRVELGEPAPERATPPAERTPLAWRLTPWRQLRTRHQIFGWLHPSEN